VNTRIILRAPNGDVLMHAPIWLPLFWAPEGGGVPFCFPSELAAASYALSSNPLARPVVQYEEPETCSE
jgi:hypothetical protein